jgi:hypothetical protein
MRYADTPEGAKKSIEETRAWAKKEYPKDRFLITMDIDGNITERSRVDTLAPGYTIFKTELDKSLILDLLTSSEKAMLAKYETVEIYIKDNRFEKFWDLWFTGASSKSSGPPRNRLGQYGRYRH